MNQMKQVLRNAFTGCRIEDLTISTVIAKQNLTFRYMCDHMPDTVKNTIMLLN